ncbi:hypothetical protein RJ639_012191 [Escallonia herrerae]|uniref:Peptidase C1A papain C-terminal domain-containing protein n=1 Tax=Escallonia herrerae TaxID=1293975 RepID=A0AA89ANB6_9ASTE|nr:hypothetical protein RJ639_012191 [Escallonia herrerae]
MQEANPNSLRRKERIERLKRTEPRGGEMVTDKQLNLQGKQPTDEIHRDKEELLTLLSPCGKLSFVNNGIYDKEPEEDAVTHFICALDAHDDDNPPSYTVRNSYGKRWGDKGYGRIAQSLVEWMAYPELEVH